MKQSQFTESQIVAILREADVGVPVNAAWRKHGISSATYYKWKAKYGGLDVSELKRVKERADGNGAWPTDSARRPSRPSFPGGVLSARGGLGGA